MGLLGTFISWGKTAWGWISGQAADVAKGFENLWHYITSLHDLLAWITGVPVLDTVRGLVNYAGDVAREIDAIRTALARISTWILNHLIMPWVRLLLGRINALAAREAADVRKLIADDIEDLRIAEAYTEVQVGIEKLARIKDVQAARAYALTLVTALHQAVEREAATGYTEGMPARLGLAGRIAGQLAVRDPAVKAAVSLLVKTALDLGAVDDPVLRFTIGTLLTRIVDKLGVDKVAGDLLAAILEPLTRAGKPMGLHDVCRDIDDRLQALEGQWAQFMDHGGAQVEQAGRDWQDITDPFADAALLGVFGLAVTDPAAFARSVTDTIGVTANGTLTPILNLLRGG